MEPILDEASLESCPTLSPSVRVLELALTLRALDSIGAPRVLRSVRDAPDRDIGGGCGLRTWCFLPGTNRDAGRFVAGRLASQPFIDGEGGLFAAAEGRDAIVEARVDERRVWGAGLAALAGGALVVLRSGVRDRGQLLRVMLTFLDGEGERSESHDVFGFVTASEIEDDRSALVRRIDLSVKDGAVLVARAAELFPRLRLGPRASEQLSALLGTEPFYTQLLRHLRALNLAAEEWRAGTAFAPAALTYSAESGATLQDGTLGPMRDFPVPDGFVAERWSLHTKLTGGPGARLYFRAERKDNDPVVLVGYFGPHLPTVRFRT